LVGEKVLHLEGRVQRRKADAVGRKEREKGTLPKFRAKSGDEGLKAQEDIWENGQRASDLWGNEKHLNHPNNNLQKKQGHLGEEKGKIHLKRCDGMLKKRTTFGFLEVKGFAPRNTVLQGLAESAEKLRKPAKKGRKRAGQSVFRKKSLCLL